MVGDDANKWHRIIGAPTMRYNMERMVDALITALPRPITIGSW